MTDFEFPERYLAVRFQQGKYCHGAYVPASELERLEHEWDQYLATGRDARITLPRLSGEVLTIRASDLLAIAEQTRTSIANDYAIDALNTQLEREVKRVVLGHDYDPERD